MFPLHCWCCDLVVLLMPPELSIRPSAASALLLFSALTGSQAYPAGHPAAASAAAAAAAAGTLSQQVYWLLLLLLLLVVASPGG
jgi:membrane-associated phospholipid phosphatase